MTITEETDQIDSQLKGPLANVDDNSEKKFKFKTNKALTLRLEDIGKQKQKNDEKDKKRHSLFEASPRKMEIVPAIPLARLNLLQN